MSDLDAEGQELTPAEQRTLLKTLAKVQRAALDAREAPIPQGATRNKTTSKTTSNPRTRRSTRS